jgi:type VI protein secretion system component Hcp
MKIRKTLVSLVFAFVLASTSSIAWAEITGPTLLTFGNVSTEVLEWEWGAENNINIGSISAGGGAGKATFQELVITRLSDHNSSEFLRIVASGEHLDTVTLTRGNLTIELKLVMISSFTVNGTSDKKEPTTESITMEFGALKLQIDGAESCWDRVTNTPCT